VVDQLDGQIVCSCVRATSWKERSTTTDTVVRARIDSDTKARATQALQAIGLSVSDAIRLMLLRVADEKRLPFAVQVPNPATLSAMKELEDGKGKRFGGAEEFFRDLDILVLSVVRSARFKRVPLSSAVVVVLERSWRLGSWWSVVANQLSSSAIRVYIWGPMTDVAVPAETPPTLPS
jgi:DNA-damage-inducible protein J